MQSDQNFVRKLAICQGALGLSSLGALANRIGCSRGTLCAPDELLLRRKCGEKLSQVEREVSEILRDTFSNLNASTALSSPWRLVPVKKIDEFSNLIDWDDRTVATDCTDESAHGILLSTGNLAPDVREGSILIVSPRGKPVNDKLCVGIPRIGGGMVAGLYNRLSGTKLKFHIAPLNSKYKGYDYGEKDFVAGPWPVAAAYQRYG